MTDPTKTQEPPMLEARVIERKRGIMIAVPPPRLTHVTLSAVMGVAFGPVLLFLSLDELRNGDVFMFAFVVMFLGFGIGCLFQLVWNLWRRETIAVDNDVIVIDRHLFGLHFREDLRIVPEAKLYYEPSHRFQVTRSAGVMGSRQHHVRLGINFGPIVYYDGNQTRRFGEGLSREEAQHLVERIHAKSPSLID